MVLGSLALVLTSFSDDVSEDLPKDPVRGWSLWLTALIEYVRSVFRESASHAISLSCVVGTCRRCPSTFQSLFC